MLFGIICILCFSLFFLVLFVFVWKSTVPWQWCGGGGMSPDGGGGGNGDLSDEEFLTTITTTNRLSALGIHVDDDGHLINAEDLAGDNSVKCWTAIILNEKDMNQAQTMDLPSGHTFYGYGLH